MWTLALIQIVGAITTVAANSMGKIYSEHDDYDADGFYRYHEEGTSSTLAMTPTRETQPTRVRRSDQTTSPVRTLSPDEIREVKGVLKDVLSGRSLEDFTQSGAGETDLRSLIDLVSTTSDLPTDLTQFTLRTSPLLDKLVRERKSDVEIEKYYVDYVYFDIYNNRKLVTSSKTLAESTPADNIASERDCAKGCARLMLCKSAVFYPAFYKNIAKCYYYDVDHLTSSLIVLSANSLKNHPTVYIHARKRLTTPEPTTTENTTTTIEITTEPQIIDIRRLVAIIANLTMNTIESNLTELFNATLQKYGIPMCGDTTTTEEPTYDFANATIVSKCFVCGMDTEEIPRNAYCADAFSGDFLPLVPVDPRAKGHIARYRKYCRYLDVPGTITNETQPRSVFGRWTGGCSVRWVDLSGVYTQRACRNRRHAAMGRHYVSKRMAKLEMALKNEDNGCIISPMSSLVPLSRGISLYARFHACVCVGNWCNSAPPARTRVPHAYLTLLAAYIAKVLVA